MQQNRTKQGRIDVGKQDRVKLLSGKPVSTCSKCRCPLFGEENILQHTQLYTQWFAQILHTPAYVPPLMPVSCSQHPFYIEPLSWMSCYSASDTVRIISQYFIKRFEFFNLNFYKIFQKSGKLQCPKCNWKVGSWKTSGQAYVLYHFALFFFSVGSRFLP